METDLLTIDDTTIAPENITLSATPSPSPYPVQCYPINGTDIKAGFYCQLNIAPATTTAQFPDYSYQEYQIGTSTEGFYFRNSLDIGELLIITFLATIIILFFSLKIWEFIFGKKVSIKRKEI